MTALLAGLAIVVLAPVFACAGAGTAHHEGGENPRGSASAVVPAPGAYAGVQPGGAVAGAAGERAGGAADDPGPPAAARPVGDNLDHLADHFDGHLDGHRGHTDCREPCCEPATALPDAVVRDDSPGLAAHPGPAPPAAAHPAPAVPGPALLRLVCVSRT
ncbi:hypothetical protein [Streptomyces synnematoformans]|uniref:hypothetical protein n=1 Tax=Streptomyces synnematoformans TaxID=415721 RepID=UPI0031E146F6